jgi:lipopolysaccharide/colanic/teichoic acid biosynthesis glycosyltransferase
MIRPSSKEKVIRVAGLMAGDFLLAWAALAIAVYIRRNVPLAFTKSLLPPTNMRLDALTVCFFGGSLLMAFGLSGFYRRRPLPHERPLIVTALLIQVAILAIGGAFDQRLLPRTILIGVLAIEWLALPTWRRFARIALPIRPRETILVGDAAQVRAAVAALNAASDRRIRVAGWVGPPNQTMDQTMDETLSIPNIGLTSNPDVRVLLREIEEVIFVNPEASPRERLELLQIRGPRGYLLLASHADALLTSSMLGWVGDQPLIEIAVGCGYGLRAVVKRTMDIVIGSLLVIVAAPFALIAAAAIWLNDRGPVLIRQPRIGLGGVTFPMWKFRSMHVPGEGRADGDGVTRIGSFLRRYRIDELPQLLNIIAGDMSLVGPRPERPEIVAQILSVLPEFELRSLVRPGLAGLAQVSAERDSRPEVKLRYDLTYMCDWSVQLDLRLLLSSVSASLSGSGL